MKKIAIAVVAGALMLGGCSNSFDGTIQNTTNQGEIRQIVVNYKHKPLTCVIINQGSNFQTMSCDFIDYYNHDNQYEGQAR